MSRGGVNGRRESRARGPASPSRPERGSGRKGGKADVANKSAQKPRSGAELLTILIKHPRDKTLPLPVVISIPRQVHDRHQPGWQAPPWNWTGIFSCSQTFLLLSETHQVCPSASLCTHPPLSPPVGSGVWPKPCFKKLILNNNDFKYIYFSCFPLRDGGTVLTGGSGPARPALPIPLLLPQRDPGDFPEVKQLKRCRL